MITRQAFSRILAVALVIGAIVLARTLPVGEWLQGLELWIRAHTVVGALAYLGLTIVAVVALTPGWIPMMLAGLLFGFMPGLLYGLFGISAGAVVALLAGRTLARGWVEKRISGNARMLALDDALEEQAFAIVALTRVALVIPFNMLNYAYGLTRVSTPTYAAATIVGMFPIVALYVYLGSIARDISQVLAGDTDSGPGTWWVAGIAIVAIAIVIFVVRRAVRRALDRRTGMVNDLDQTST
ncbi:MAG: TVP38/TMEM64 family protein [Gammaproteobacteria bacterium]|nr:TVP38/TMEM64 family protein [Gammaproteobacteria bacterium]